MHITFHSNDSIVEVLPNIFRIPVPLPNNPLKVLNSYLICGKERSLLIDTGFRMDACREALLQGLEELKQDRDTLDIFVTHLHSDHSGLAAEIVRPGCSIFVSEIDKADLDALVSDQNYWGRTTTRFREMAMPDHIVENMAAIHPAASFAPLQGGQCYTGVKAGQILSVGDYQLRCILTPGHTPGHMCLWDEAHRIMFTGDHVLFDITPNITNWPSVADSLGDYLEGLRTVAEFPVEVALPGHRGLGDYHARIAQLLAHHQIRLDEALSIVTSMPGETTYNIAGHMSWSIRAKNWEDFPDAQKIFATGECQSHLDHLLMQGKIRREKDGDYYRYYSV